MEITNGAFIIDSLGKILVTHATGHTLAVWSVPKGLYEEGERSKEAAIRETLEETNLDLSLYENVTFYKELGIEGYINKNKKIQGHLFLVDFPLSKLNLDLTCTSMFKCVYTGMELPENDIAKWETLEFAERLLHEAQQKFLKKITKLLVSKQLK
tara:strand:- start:5452 stop:5916 length:465 start_codon:yes stop_codon:yes gene_type:complete